VHGWEVGLLSMFTPSHVDKDVSPSLPKRNPKNETPQQGFPATYVYTGNETAPVGVRESPSLTAPKTGQVVKPGGSIKAVRVVTTDGIPFAVLPSVRHLPVLSE
jgi:hypothetical protein